MALTLSKKALILVAVPLAFELGFVGVFAILLHQVDHERAREAHARDVAAHLNLLLRLVLERSSSLIVSHFTSKENFRRRADNAKKRSYLEKDVITKLVADVPHEKEAWDKIYRAFEVGDNYFDKAKTMVDIGNKMAAGMEMIKVNRLMDEVFQAIDHLVEEQEAEQLERKRAQAAYREQIQYLLYAAVAFNILLAISLALYFNRGTSARLKVLLDNTYKLAAEKPLAEPIGGDDELGHLDKTFHKMAEALAALRRKEHAILMSAADIICTLDKDRRFTAANPAVTKHWGYEPDDLIGRKLDQLLLEEDAKSTVTQIENIIDSKNSAAFTNRVITNDERERDCEWSVVWSDQENSLMCVVHDITERKQIDQMKQDFVAMVSHDLRTPLTSIQMVHSLLAAGAYGQLSEDGLDSIGGAQNSVDRLISLVNDLLDLERMEAGRMDLDIEAITISDLLKPSIAVVETTARNKSIKIDSSDVIDASVLADEERIIQVLINLLANSIKFSPKDTVIKITATHDGKFATIAIIDEGRGVPESMRQAIFERFKQVKKADAANKKGSGLGLAISKAIVELHGGTIGVDSEEGKGSKFHFSLPLSAECVEGTKSLQSEKKT